MIEGRPTPPPLQIQLPICPLCGNTVEKDGGVFRCFDCEAYWPTENAGHEPGEWDHVLAPQCDSIDGRRFPGGWLAKEYGPDVTVRRCMLAAGHHPATDHTWTDPAHHRHCWDDAQAATSEQLTAVLTGATA